LLPPHKRVAILSSNSRVSSVVEQRFCKPLVGSSILSPGTNEIGSFPAFPGRSVAAQFAHEARTLRSSAVTRVGTAGSLSVLEISPPVASCPTPASSRSSRAAVSLGAQARRLAYKIKTSSDFADAELQRKANPCAHKCSDHCQNLDGNRHRSAKFQGWPAEGMRQGPRNRGAYK
jgi:hypothetical protein